MKTFYDLLDTDRQIHFTVELDSMFATLPPYVTLKVNGQVLHDGPLTSKVRIQGSFDNTAHLTATITLSGKQYKKDSTSAVKLKSFIVDGFEIKDHMVHQSTYCHDSADGHSGVTDHVGWNGTWGFDAGMPFYHFKHKVQNRGWLIHPE